MLRPRPLAITRLATILLLAALAVLTACMPTTAAAAAAGTDPATAVSRASLCDGMTTDNPAGDEAGGGAGRAAAAPPPVVTVHPGDIIENHVVIESLEPVAEAVAFADLVAGRRLLNSGCRKCSCLPRCSRCLINKCHDGLCSGLCRVPTAGQRCAILRCSTDRSDPAF